MSGPVQDSGRDRSDRRRGIVGTSAKVRFLSRPEHYPDLTAAVEVVETHMSWVFVTDDFVYKMKKPVRLPFLDFSTLTRRRECCEASVRLNRRLAPDVYLGVVALRRDGAGTLCLGCGRGRAVEWLEKMRRLPRARMLDVALSRGAVIESDVRRFAAVLARFYQHAPAERMAAADFRAQLEVAVEANRRALMDPALGLSARVLHDVAAGLCSFLEREAGLFRQRIAQGRVVEAHGDLRPEHVCLLAEPVVIDCLEFDRVLRVQDVADELGYLALECELAGGGWVGPTLFGTYAAITGDRLPTRLVAFYQAHRALLRAKLSAWHLPDYPPESHPHWLAQAAAYLALAEGRLKRFG